MIIMKIENKLNLNTNTNRKKIAIFIYLALFMLCFSFVFCCKKIENKTKLYLHLKSQVNSLIIIEKVNGRRMKMMMMMMMFDWVF